MNYSTLVDLIRRNVGAAEPQAGGEDVLSDDVIIEYLNDAYTMMNDAISGFPSYVEFTITVAGVITETKPVSNAPTVAAQSPQQLSYPTYTISDARSYVELENMTVGIVNTSGRRMIRKTYDNRNYQAFYNGTSRYHSYSDIIGKRGFTLMPLTITQTNTIGVTYRRTFIRYAVGTLGQTAGTGLSDLSISGIFTNTTRFEDGDYAIKITTQGDQDKFKVSFDGGVTYTGAELNCVVTATGLGDGNGLAVTFGAITGHTLNDEWKFTATAPSLEQLTEEEQRTFPRHWCRACCAEDVDDDRANQWLVKAVGPDYFSRQRVGGVLGQFVDNRIDIDLTADDSLDNPMGI